MLTPANASLYIWYYKYRGKAILKTLRFWHWQIYNVFKPFLRYQIVRELFKNKVKVHVLNVGLLEDTAMGNFITTLLVLLLTFFVHHGGADKKNGFPQSRKPVNYFLEPPTGFEPATPSLRMKCSTDWATVANIDLLMNYILSRPDCQYLSPAKAEELSKLLAPLHYSYQLLTFYL